MQAMTHDKTLQQHTATAHCNSTLHQHTATTLCNTATLCATASQTPLGCAGNDALQHTATTHCNNALQQHTLQHQTTTPCAGACPSHHDCAANNTLSRAATTCYKDTATTNCNHTIVAELLCCNNCSTLCPGASLKRFGCARKTFS